MLYLFCSSTLGLLRDLCEALYTWMSDMGLVWCEEIVLKLKKDL
jgi:hypothetical protein